MKVMWLHLPLEVQARILAFACQSDGDFARLHVLSKECNIVLSYASRYLRLEYDARNRYIPAYLDTVMSTDRCFLNGDIAKFDLTPMDLDRFSLCGLQSVEVSDVTDTHYTATFMLHLPQNYGIPAVSGVVVRGSRVEIPVNNEDDMFVLEGTNPTVTGEFVANRPPSYARSDRVAKVSILTRGSRSRLEECIHGFCNDFRSPLLTKLWREHQAKQVREGVLILDGAIPEPLVASLRNYISALKEDVVAMDPQNGLVRRGLVDPALHPYIKGVTPTKPTAARIKPHDTIFDDRGWGADIWGNQFHEDSSVYQWLPTYFDISQDGQVSIRDYINNLVPRGRYDGLYTDLATLFAHALPLVESAYSYGCMVRRKMRTSDISDHDGDEEMPPLPVELLSLRGSSLQVITEIVDYELSPGQTYDEGVWHVEGASHENIVATAVYILDRDPALEGGDLLFKRPLLIDEASRLIAQLENSSPIATWRQFFNEYINPLGKLATSQDRLFCFPNCHVHKVGHLENTTLVEQQHDMEVEGEGAGAAAAEIQEPAAKKPRRSLVGRILGRIKSGSRGSSSTKPPPAPVKANGAPPPPKPPSIQRMVAFHVVDPEQRIMSTREVPPQQHHAGGGMGLEEALAHRARLREKWEVNMEKESWDRRLIFLD